MIDRKSRAAPAVRRLLLPLHIRPNHGPKGLERMCRHVPGGLIARGLKILFCHVEKWTYFCTPKLGEMAERSIAAVLKTVDL